MSRRVALIAANFWPEPTGVGQVTWEFARYLAEAGLQVRVATAMPYYPQWEIWPAYRGKLWMFKSPMGMSRLPGNHVLVLALVIQFFVHALGGVLVQYVPLF